MMDEPSKSRSEDPSVRERYVKALSSIAGGDRETAKKLLKENISEGCSDSMVLLGTVLADGNEDERKESVSLFEKAHALGNDSGTRNLAYCYAIGLNVEKDKQKGAELYILAAEAGNARAMCNIGVMYDYGNGVEQDHAKAFQWYLRSANAGYSRGMTNLGEHYMKGEGTDKDIDEAERWFKASGSPRALYRLSEIYLDIRGDKENGVAYLMKSADAKYSRGMYRYGRMIESDDRDEAVRLYTDAAAKGNKDACERLRELDIDIPERKRRK